MSYCYEVGAVRWKRHDGNGDVRSSKVPAGWSASASILDDHPVTGKPLKYPQWWLRFEFDGERDKPRRRAH